MVTKLKKGFIASIQMYSASTVKDMAQDAIRADAVAIRVDKNIHINTVPVIGLKRIKVDNRAQQAFITPTIADVLDISKWADFIAIDFRMLNKDLPETVEYCRHNQINVIADIGSMADYENIIKNNWKPAYISTALSVFYLTRPYFPDKLLLKQLIDAGCKNVIAEGNYKLERDVREAYEVGACNVCIGSAISDVYKLVKNYTRITPGWKSSDSVNTAVTYKSETNYNQ